MPIHPDQRHRYPADLRAIGRAIRARAGQACERCRVPDRAWGWRDEDGRFQLIDRERFAGPQRPPFLLRQPDGRLLRIIEIVLTVAHLDHHPENNAAENLQALCQRCHLAHDRPHHVATRRSRIRAAMRTSELTLPPASGATA